MSIIGTTTSPQQYLQALSRWRPLEIAFWLATLLPFVLFPNYLSLASQIAITALFALSLDLILGYAGIVSLGHAAFFGIGAYTAGIVFQIRLGRVAIPGLLVAAAMSQALVGYASSFIIARFRHLTLIMITLGLGLLLHEAANSASWLTGGSDGLQGVAVWPLFGLFKFDLYGYNRLRLFAGRAVRAVPGGTAADQFAVRPGAARHSRKLGTHAGDRRTEPRPYPQDLYHRRRLRRYCRRGDRANYARPCRWKP